MAMRQVFVKQYNGVNKIQFFCTHCNHPHLNHPSGGVCRRCGRM